MNHQGPSVICSHPSQELLLLFTISCERMQKAISVFLSRNPSSYVERLFEKPQEAASAKTIEQLINAF